MGVLDTELVRFAEDFIRTQGGVSGLVSKLDALGLGDVARTWTANGANRPISAAQLQRVVGFQALTELGAKHGVSPDAVAAKFAEVLPAIVDKLTVRTGTASGPYPWTGTRKR
jgi:uncharacterized protein YidB (DUF937 family)